MTFNYEWRLSDGYPAKGIKHHKKKVFGTFICGGGSSMGYKLAGYEHLGGVEIDPQVAKIYKANHNPAHLYNEDIRLFNQRDDLPDDLFDLDLLDGSPPCSSFSMAGAREKGWSKEKKFREGQAHQKLDDLVFEYVNTIGKLKPKVAILENVKGLIQGNAKAYAQEIHKKLKGLGYKPQLFLLNAASMGVPQKRERVFYVALRNDIDLPPLTLNFTNRPITFKEVDDGPSVERKPVTSDYSFKLLKNVTRTGVLQVEKQSENGKLGAVGFGFCCLPNVTPNTITSGGQVFYSDKKHYVSKNEICKIGSYPVDYNFIDIDPQYLIGMSVPPVMTAQIANQIYNQWLSKL